MSSFAGLLRLASVVICLTVVASFTIFAVDQTKGASARQQEELTAGTKSETKAPPKSATAHESGLHTAIDEVSNQLTSPFTGLTSGSSQWTTRSVNLLLVLVIYGFGLGYLARVIRVRF